MLIAGKGAEQGQQFADRTIPFDDREAAREALRALGARHVIPLTLEELRSLGLGRLEGDAARVTGVEIDSRRVGPGDLFVALGGGVAFLDDARAHGAAATLVPDDDFAAMAALGRAVRGRSDARVVAITGSSGKTSTKDILAALCRPVARTVAAEGGHNNEIGLPLTLTRIERDTEVVITEMGMRGLGQIAELCAIAQPDVGVITSIGPVHLELVGTVENVARAKAEASPRCPSAGSRSSRPASPELEPLLVRTTSTSCRFGRGGDAWLEPFDPGERVVVAFCDGERVELPVPFTARMQAANLVAALAAYRALGLPLERAAEGSAEIVFSPWRCEESPLPGGGLLINDAYNANPASMRAALEHLVDRAQRRRKVAVLGEMAELGVEAPRFHEELGAFARELGVDVVVGVGELGRRYEPDEWAADAAAAVAVVRGRRRARRRRAREGVAGRRARGRRRCARGGDRVLTRVLIAALVALIVSILIGPKFIEFLRRNEFGQHIREEGPQHHFSKQGTPTMGGLMILFAATIAFLPVSHYRLQSLTVLFVTLACGAIGFLDDFMKLTHRRSLGLTGRWKLLLLAGVTVVVGDRRPPPEAEHRRLHPDRRRLDPALVRVVPVPVHHHRRRVERDESRRRRRRARGRHGDHLAVHVHGDDGRVVRPLRASFEPQPDDARPRDHRRRADRRHGRLPLVQRVPRRGVHGRHRLDGVRRRARDVRDHDEDGAAAPPDRRHLRDRGALGDDPGRSRSDTSAGACS